MPLGEVTSTCHPPRSRVPSLGDLRAGLRRGARPPFARGGRGGQAHPRALCDRPGTAHGGRRPARGPQARARSGISDRDAWRAGSRPSPTSMAAARIRAVLLDGPRQMRIVQRSELAGQGLARGNRSRFPAWPITPKPMTAATYAGSMTYGTDADPLAQAVCHSRLPTPGGDAVPRSSSPCPAIRCRSRGTRSLRFATPAMTTAWKPSELLLELRPLRLQRPPRCRMASSRPGALDDLVLAAANDGRCGRARRTSSPHFEDAAQIRTRARVQRHYRYGPRMDRAQLSHWIEAYEKALAHAGHRGARRRSSPPTPRTARARSSRPATDSTRSPPSGTPSASPGRALPHDQRESSPSRGTRASRVWRSSTTALLPSITGIFGSCGWTMPAAALSSRSGPSGRRSEPIASAV